MTFARSFALFVLSMSVVVLVQVVHGPPTHELSCQERVELEVHRAVKQVDFECGEREYQAYNRGWTNAAMGTCAP